MNYLGFGMNYTNLSSAEVLYINETGDIDAIDILANSKLLAPLVVIKDKMVKIYTYCFLASVFIGAIIELKVVWTFADIFNALMAIPNLIALLLLSKVLVSETNKYLWSDRLDAED